MDLTIEWNVSSNDLKCLPLLTCIFLELKVYLSVLLLSSLLLRNPVELLREASDRSCRG